VAKGPGGCPHQASGEGRRIGPRPGIFRHPLAEKILQGGDHLVDAEAIGHQFGRILGLAQGGYLAAGIEPIALGKAELS